MKPHVLMGAVHSLGRVPLVSEISRFHGQLLRLLTFLSIWVHWDACLQYGSCANPRHNRLEAVLVVPVRHPCPGQRGAVQTCCHHAGPR